MHRPVATIVLLGASALLSGVAVAQETCVLTPAGTTACGMLLRPNTEKPAGPAAAPPPGVETRSDERSGERPDERRRVEPREERRGDERRVDRPDEPRVESLATSPARMSGGATVSTNGAPAPATGIGATRG